MILVIDSATAACSVALLDAAETVVELYEEIGRGHGRAVDALPRAAHAALLPEALRSLPARPIYGRAPDARPMQ